MDKVNIEGAETFIDCTVIPSVELEYDGVTNGAEKDEYSVKELKARMAVLMGGMGTDIAQIEDNAAMIADATSRRGRRLTRAQRRETIAELKEEAEAAARAVLRKETIKKLNGDSSTEMAALKRAALKRAALKRRRTEMAALKRQH
uniref:Uncharacterized protein n=1 Tax=Globodera rostochiensis TaxID=31243 RepID=A0A914HSS1_GLORO